MHDVARELEELYRQRRMAFRRAMATVTGDYDLARDAVQDGFALAYARRASFQGRSSLEAWVWRITLHAALRQRRRRGRVDVVAPDALEHLETQVVAPERRPELAAALAALPPRQRLIVFLHYYGDLSYGRIAEVLETQEGTVAATLAAARASLRRALTQGART